MSELWQPGGNSTEQSLFNNVHIVHRPVQNIQSVLIFKVCFSAKARQKVKSLCSLSMFSLINQWAQGREVDHRHRSCWSPFHLVSLPAVLFCFFCFQIDSPSSLNLLSCPCQCPGSSGEEAHIQPLVDGRPGNLEMKSAQNLDIHPLQTPQKGFSTIFMDTVGPHCSSCSKWFLTLLTRTQPSMMLNHLWSEIFWPSSLWRQPGKQMKQCCDALEMWHIPDDNWG